MKAPSLEWPCVWRNSSPSVVLRINATAQSCPHANRARGLHCLSNCLARVSHLQDREWRVKMLKLSAVVVNEHIFISQITMNIPTYSCLQNWATCCFLYTINGFLCLH